MLPKTASQNYFLKLLPKAAKASPKNVAENSFPKLLSKDVPQSCRFSKQLFLNAIAKPQSCSPRLFPKATLQSCYRKPRPKEAPQNSAYMLKKQAQCLQ